VKISTDDLKHKKKKTEKLAAEDLCALCEEGALAWWFIWA
jgi:hypothetical protein